MSARLLRGSGLTEVMRAFRSALVEHESTINQLNVFPVPDGDTGTNLRSTVDAVVAALEAAGPGDDEVADAIAQGSLLGARGNSGIILAQFLRAFVAALRKSSGPAPLALASAYRLAAEAARSAVTSPKEGTVLSVATAAAEGATLAAPEAHDAGQVARVALEWANEALARTPSQLAVLAEAGVVDAGGAGLTLLFGSVLLALCPSVLNVSLELPAWTRARLTEDAGHGVLEVSSRPMSDAPNYEVMFLLEGTDDAVEQLRTTWATLGDSIAIVGDAPTFSCHIHTSDVGAAIESAIEAGRLRQIRVTDLSREVAARAAYSGDYSSLLPESGALPFAPKPAPEDTTCAVIAVANGSGLERVLRSLGATQVVDGGRSMNPSTEEIFSALLRAGASEVVVLPNSNEVLGVALAAAELARSEREAPRAVEVLETRNVAEAISALLRFDASRPAAKNLLAMREALSTVVTGEVRRATRAATIDGVSVEAGEYLGLSEGRLLSHSSDLADTVVTLVAALADDAHEIATVYSGAALRPGELREIVEALGRVRPDLAVEPVEGGQASSELLVALE